MKTYTLQSKPSERTYEDKFQEYLVLQEWGHVLVSASSPLMAARYTVNPVAVYRMVDNVWVRIEGIFG